MIIETIDIRGRIFLEDPAIRFATIFRQPHTTWREIWRRYKILDYSEEEAREYAILITKKRISPKQFKRWVNRTEVYNRAQVAVKKGANKVTKDYFGPFQGFVVTELKKNIKS